LRSWKGEQLARFLAHAGPHRPLFEFLAYTGLRVGEALGPTWADIDLDAGLIRVHRVVGKAFRATVQRAAITATGRLSLHSLRHGYASLLIAKGLNVVFVSRQLGHANPTVTLSTYAHLFEARKPRSRGEGGAGDELCGDSSPHSAVTARRW